MIAQPGGPVVIATRGDPSSDAAVRVGGMFATRCHRGLDVLAILRPAVTPGIAYAQYAEAVHDAASRAIAARMRDQVAHAVPDAPASVRVEMDEPAGGIAAHADTVGASLIVLGLGQHRAIDRVLGLETAIGVIRRAHTPVLAVAPDAQVRMTVVALATDFGPAAARAAHVALELASDDARVHLLHVAESIDASTSRRLDEFAASLPLGARSTLTSHVLHGDPADAISSFCRESGAELVALGTHGKGFVDRLRLGSVAESVLRHARCSVLVAPPAS